MAQSKGKYIFLDAETDEEENKSTELDLTVHWRLPQYFSDFSGMDKLKNLHNQIVKFNEKINLVSKKSINNSDLLNFYDSIVSSKSILKDSNAQEIYDIGSGNGFPGLILAIMAPDRNITLLDRDKRKTEFLKYVSSKLLLKNVNVKCCEFSDLEPGSISCAVTRGFASLSKSLLLAKRIFKPDSSFYHLKGPLWSNEVGEMPPQLIGHWKTSLLSEYKLPEELGDRYVVKTIFR